MPQSQEAGLPPMILTDGFKIAFEARDATGAAVASVNIATPHILADKQGDIELVQIGGPFLYVPGPDTG